LFYRPIIASDHFLKGRLPSIRLHQKIMYRSLNLFYVLCC
jgi:hypothetical protein